jgi:hypothetical protein
VADVASEAVHRFDEYGIRDTEDWKFTAVGPINDLEAVLMALGVPIPSCVQDRGIAGYERGHPMVLLLVFLFSLLFFFEPECVVLGDAVDWLVGRSRLKVVEHAELLANDFDLEVTVDDLPAEHIPVFDFYLAADVCRDRCLVARDLPFADGLSVAHTCPASARL